MRISDWSSDVFSSDLLKAGGGALVAVITAAVEKVPSRDICSAAPKAAIEMLFRGVALEEGRFGIRANCVGPGFIDAGLGHELLSKPGLEDFTEGLRKMLPLKRFEIGRAHVRTPVTNAHLVCRLRLEKKKQHTTNM